ncbi:MAG: hybrid sensor histidine kinase/response regulator [Alphaproteobacteria bacterium]|nr:hybrid sensor histidine kinase/response regulator [Alphaproteobacteria bacterium]
MNGRSIQPLSHQILAEQLNLISQQIKIILIIVFVLSSLAIFAFWTVVPHEILVTWFALVNFPSLMRLVLFYAQKKYSIELRLLGVLNILLAAWSGTAWGAVGYFFPLYGDAAMLQFITVALFGLTSGSVSGLSSFSPTYFAFSIPVMTTLAYRHYSIGGDVNISISIFCIIFLIINLAFSLILQKSFLQSIRLRFENTDLVRNLRLEKDKAISASEAKSSFLAATSHDLRQPLHAMGFFIESLEKLLTSPGQLHLLQKIEHTSNNLRGQLNDLLDISKIDAGIIKPHVIPLSLNDIFNSLQRTHAPMANEKNITFNILPVSWIIESDAHMIDRVLNNLVSNAIRYTDNGGKVLLGCRKKGDELRIEVHDTGIGIPSHLTDNIFTEYYQIDNPERDQNKGLGLGLSIVKGMCELLGYNIEVHSIIGKGTSFYLTVPLSNRLPVLARDSTQQINMTMKTGNIILIDDESDTLDAMSHLIGNWGHMVLSFSAEGEALNYLNEHDFMPDMIITDFRLRERRTGTQAITAINSYLNKDIPAIIITGDTARDRMLQAQESGHVLLHKPILPAKLKAVINHTLLETDQIH